MIKEDVNRCITAIRRELQSIDMSIREMTGYCVDMTNDLERIKKNVDEVEKEVNR